MIGLSNVKKVAHDWTQKHLDVTTLNFVFLHAGDEFSSAARVVAMSLDSIVQAAIYHLECAFSDPKELMSTPYRYDFQIVDGRVVLQKGRSTRQTLQACSSVLSQNGNVFVALPVLQEWSAGRFVSMAEKVGQGAEAQKIVDGVRLIAFGRKVS